jgi:succinoglycan biosynthesis protein ExoA
MPDLPQKLPYVTVIMPIRNEAAYIEGSLRAVLDQDYPGDRLQVLVVDGRSDDGTRTIVTDLLDNADIDEGRLLDNPSLIVPSGLNLALAHARGEVIVRVDGHCEVPRDYLKRCIAALEQVDADCAGGVVTTVGETRVARAIALAQSSAFGVGGVAFRSEKGRARYVDTLAFGAYRRDVFERIGGFDESLVRNQDDEFNLRLIRSGGKIWMDPSIRSRYYSRSNLKDLWKQYHGYGFYKWKVMKKHRTVPSWRHVVPATFVASLLLAALTSAWLRRPGPLAAVLLPYLSASTATALVVGSRHRSVAPLLPVTFACLHVAYGLGTLEGIARTVRSSDA